MKYLVSACLCGVNCKYNGGNNCCDEVLELSKENTVIPVCPEQLGGLATPRPPAEIVHGDGYDVLDGRTIVKVVASDQDITSCFIKGASETLKIARLLCPDIVILQQRSPSCGCGKVYNSGKLVPGNGVTAAFLQINGFKVQTIE